MKSESCPCCGRALPKAKTVDVLFSVPPADWTERQVYAYYKRIAPVSDLAFTRRNASAELQARIDAIVRPTAKDAEAMRSARRIELQNAEHASGQPAIGSERWHAEYNAVELVNANNESEAA